MAAEPALKLGLFCDVGPAFLEGSSHSTDSHDGLAPTAPQPDVALSLSTRLWAHCWGPTGPA